MSGAHPTIGGGTGGGAQAPNRKVGGAPIALGPISPRVTQYLGAPQLQTPSAAIGLDARKYNISE